jgi:hypothetical protein
MVDALRPGADLVVTAILTAIVTSRLQGRGLPDTADRCSGFIVLAAMSTPGVPVSLLPPTRHVQR